MWNNRSRVGIIQIGYMSIQVTTWEHRSDLFAYWFIHNSVDERRYANRRNKQQCQKNIHVRMETVFFVEISHHTFLFLIWIKYNISYFVNTIKSVQNSPYGRKPKRKTRKITPNILLTSISFRIARQFFPETRLVKLLCILIPSELLVVTLVSYVSTLIMAFLFCSACLAKRMCL